MFKSLFYLLISIFIMSCATSGNNGAEDSADTSNFSFAENNDGLNLPENCSVVVVHEGLGRGRYLAVRDNGDIYVHLRAPDSLGHTIIALRDTDNDGVADREEGFSEVGGTGIEIHNDYIYYANTTEIFRSPLVEGQLLPGDNREKLVTMVEGRGHTEKSFAFDGQGNMYVNIGSMSNACQEETRTAGSKGLMPCVELETRGGIWRFSDSEQNQEQSLDKRWATGLRNALALEWHPGRQSIFAASHGRDDLHRYWPDLFTEEENVVLPAEEFFEIKGGDDFGWPYCFFNQIKGEKLLNPEYGGDGEIVDRCENAKDPLIGFPGHWAPNDMLIYDGDMFPEKYQGGIFIAWHGSWNRLNHDQDGYKVVFIPTVNGEVSGDYETFIDGFIGAESIQAPGEAQYRPCGLSQGPDGSIYIVDSVKGRVWRVVYTA